MDDDASALDETLEEEGVVGNQEDRENPDPGMSGSSHCPMDEGNGMRKRRLEMSPSCEDG